MNKAFDALNNVLIMLTHFLEATIPHLDDFLVVFSMEFLARIMPLRSMKSNTQDFVKNLLTGTRQSDITDSLKWTQPPKRKFLLFVAAVNHYTKLKGRYRIKIFLSANLSQKSGRFGFSNVILKEYCVYAEFVD